MCWRVKTIAAVVGLSLLLVPIPTAQGALPQTEVGAQTLTPKKVTVDGEPGVWLPSKQMAKVENRLEQADKMEPLIESQRGLIKSQEKLITTSSRAVQLALQVGVQEKLRADDYKALGTKQAQELDESRSLLRSPFLWGTVGAVLGVAFGIFLAAKTPQTVVVK